MIRVSNDEGSLSVWINDTQMRVIDQDGERVWAECTLDDLMDETADSFPETLRLHIESDDGFGTHLFGALDIAWQRDGAAVEFAWHQSDEDWDGRTGLSTFLSTLRDHASLFDNWEVAYIELEEDYKGISLRCVVAPGQRLRDSIITAAHELSDLVRLTEVALSGLTWKREYETDEIAFCREVIYPLLLRMEFRFVRYGHGTREYGKDFTFSELTRFGNYRHYGLQAKAGNVSGEVNSKLSELLGQTRDAFEMPYYELGSRDPYYISTYVIAISGRFTENAREKIVEKMPKGLVGSVYFLDRQRIEELVVRYWHN